MTREEAKEILTHNWTRVDNPNYSESELDEAFFMAIEALSLPRGDLISRADVFEIIDKAFSQPMGNVVTLYADICLMLNVLPTHANSRSTHERDLINRADAMGAVQDHFNADGFKGYDDGQKMMDRIKVLPSADAVQGWITDRNPTENGTYIVTIADEDGGFVCELHYGEPLLPICKVNGSCWYDSDDEFGDCPYYDIIAWMPLPTPYRERREP